MLTKITFTESQQNVNTSEIEHTCPTFTSLKNEYEAKIAKLMQDMKTCGNQQTIGMSLEYYNMMAVLLFIFGRIQIIVTSMKDLNLSTKIEYWHSLLSMYRIKNRGRYHLIFAGLKTLLCTKLSAAN